MGEVVKGMSVHGLFTMVLYKPDAWSFRQVGNIHGPLIISQYPCKRENPSLSRRSDAMIPDPVRCMYRTMYISRKSTPNMMDVLETEKKKRKKKPEDPL